MNIKKLVNQYIYWPEVENKYQSNVDISNVTLVEITPLLKEMQSLPKTFVTDSVIRFYGMNEILAKMRQENENILKVEALDLYKTYTAEVEDLSKKMFSYVLLISLMEGRHSIDFESIVNKKNSYKNNYDYSYATAEDKKKLEKYSLNEYRKFKRKLIKMYVDKYSVDKNRFSIFYDLVEDIHVKSKSSTEGDSSTERDAIQDGLFEALNNSQFKKLTLGELAEFSKVLFKKNNFRSGYGGDPWAQIIEHGENFIKGKINAEVFVDQSFSLEHNGGQIFNKDMIFNVENTSSWESFNLSDSHHYNSLKYYSFNNSQVLLNAQHKGQLLNLLNADYSKENQLFSLTILNLKELKENNIIPKDLSEENFNQLINRTSSNFNNLDTIIGKFKGRNNDFVNMLKKYEVKVGNLDMLELLNGVHTKDCNIEIKKEYESFYRFGNIMALKKEYIQEKKEKKKEYVFSFKYTDTKNLESDFQKKEYLGNKALGLTQMQALNLPVPEALVFPTTNAASFYQEKTKWLAALRPELKKLGEFFRDRNGNPVAVSVRSGSAVSMPGMMDTVLNVGIDDTNYEYFCKKMGKEVVNESVIKFMTLFTKSLFGRDVDFSGDFKKALYQFRNVLEEQCVTQNYQGFFPLNAKQQYRRCLEAVFSSWNSERAKAYREHNGISENIGTAAIVQKMVFGNLNENSCTGVVFSRDCISGQKGIIGEFLIKAQGEDVVSGAVTPKNIREMEGFNKAVYDKLVTICEDLEKRTSEIQDIEFTVEDGELYILQKRKAVCSAMAEAKLNHDLYESGLITKEKMINSIKLESLLTKDVMDTQGKETLAKGLVGNPGVMRGIVVTCEEDMLTYSELYKDNRRDTNFGWILYSPETSPNHAPIMIKTDAFVTSNGGFTSHAAILSRSWDKPCVVGIQSKLKAGEIISLDANNGQIYKGILPLKEGNNHDMEIIVNAVLEHHKVDLNGLNNTNKKIEDINKKKTWMEGYKKANKILTNKTTKFLSIGQKIAVILIKNQTELNRFQEKKISNDIQDDFLKENSLTEKQVKTCKNMF